MPEPLAPIDDIAAQIADGTPIDWIGISAKTDSHEIPGRVLDNLRIVARVAALHSSSSFLSSLTSGSLGAIEASQLDGPLPAGSMWGHLRILECVGQGRFGVVYRAFDATLQREVALKIVSNRSATGSEIVHEGRMMARVHHPNVVTVFGAQVIGDVVGIWMQFVRGQTLAAELQIQGPFAADDIIRVGWDLCEALTAVHEVGLVHRDVKAANVMRDVNDRIVLGDFGTGQLIDDARSGMAGTPLYLAPEVMAGAPATPQSDIYSLGVLLFHLATNRYPVDGRSIRELRAAHRSANRHSLAALRPDLPPVLVDAITRAIIADPAARWTAARTFRTMLDAARAPTRARSRGFASALSGISVKTAAFFAAAAVATFVLVSSAATVPPTETPSPAAGTPTITTRSTRALRLYTVAANMMQGPAPWPEAESQRLLREALGYDPEFASARILLAHSLNNQDRPLAEVLTEAARAVDTATSSSEAERAFIEGSFYHFRGEAEEDLVKRQRDLEHAAGAYERLLGLAPKHVWGYMNLANVYGLLHRNADVLRIWLLNAKNHPDSAMRQAWVAAEYYRVGAFDDAEPFITRAHELMRHQADNDLPVATVWLSFAPAHRSWFADSAAEALRLVDAVAPPESDAHVALLFARQKVALYLALGRLDDAERASSIAPTAAGRDDLLLAVFVYRNDRDAMKELLAGRYTSSADVARVLWLPVPTDIIAPHLLRLLADPPGRWRRTHAGMFVAGRVALADGRWDDAIALLQAYAPFQAERDRMLTATNLADAWIGKGDAARAIAELESATRLRSETTAGPSSTGALWIQTRAKLAELYRRTGQVSEAQRIEQHLQQLLIVADDDHPLKTPH
jgi:serine/threonine protein kinase/tetratricopeptide (TPR) repeat protein